MPPHDLASLLVRSGALADRRCHSRAKGFEPAHRSAPLFNGSMVLLHDVVEVSTCTHLHLPPTVIFLTKQSQGSQGCLIPIDVDLLRPWDLSMGNNCTEKCLRGLHIAIGTEQRPDGLSMLVHGPK